MRHKVYGRHLGRTKNQRTALFKSLVRSLFIAESIETTEAKAKSIKGLVDSLITQAKSADTRRLISQYIANPKIEEKLVKDLAPRMKSRISGYTSVIKLGRRLGDGAMMVKVSLLTDSSSKTANTEVEAAPKEDKTEIVDAEIVSEPVAKKEKKATKK